MKPKNLTDYKILYCSMVEKFGKKIADEKIKKLIAKSRKPAPKKD